MDVKAKNDYRQHSEEGTAEGLGISVYGVQWVRNTGVSLQAIVDPKDSEGPGQV